MMSIKRKYIKWALLIFALVVMLLVCIMSYVKKSNALEVINEFCSEYKIKCEGGYSTSILSPNTHPFEAILTGQLPRLFDVFIKFYKEDDKRREPSKSFIVDGKSGEVKVYFNYLLYYDSFSARSAKVTYNNKGKDRKQKDETTSYKIISKAKATKLINSLALELKIPDDMVLDKISLDKKHAMYSAHWFREKDGYRYETDNMFIGISDITGDLTGYGKTYMDSADPIKIDITKEEAIETGWKKLIGKLPGKYRKDAKDMFNVHAAPLIVEPPSSVLHCLPGADRKPRLAWIVKFLLKGDIEMEQPFKRREEYTGDELKKYDKLREKRMIKSSELGLPFSFFEVRVDTKSGKVIGMTHVIPKWMTYFVR